MQRETQIHSRWKKRENFISFTAECSQDIKPAKYPIFPNCANPKAKLLSQEQKSIDI